MITTVRIAPVEQWCEEAVGCYKRNGYNGQAIVGQEILIDTETMREWNEREASHYNPNACTGRYWKVESESEKKITSLTGAPPLQPYQQRVICEHMLEMD